MRRQSWDRRFFLVVPFVAVIAAACGGDDQPAGAGGGVDASGDGAGGDGAADGGQGDSTTNDGGGTDGTMDARVSDVVSETVFGSDSSDGDLQPPKDGAADDGGVPDAGCGPKTGFSSSDAGACAIGQTYSCQGSTYAIECDCPAAECRCKKNGAIVGPVLLYGGCGTCTAPRFDLLASDCPVPYTGGP